MGSGDRAVGVVNAGWFGAVAVQIVGTVLVIAGVVSTRQLLRSRRRLERTTGVIVGDAPHTGGSLGTAPMRSARLRFTTRQGRVVERVSDVHSSWGPRIGKEVTVIYDPADPDGTGDTVGAWRFKVALTPVILLIGIGMVVLGTVLLGR
jgi:hypothetical protein